MPSFVCDACQDTIKKPKLDQHRCGATFSCIDCGVTFRGTDYRSHFTCVSEAEKYQKALYKGKRVLPQPGTPQGKATPVSQAVASPAESPAAPAKRKNESNDDGKKAKKSKSALAAALEANDVSAGVEAALIAALKNSEVESLTDATPLIVSAMKEAGFEDVSKKTVRATLLSRVAPKLGADGAITLSWE